MGNVTAKTSGDIASFMTPAETNIKSLKVHFSPKQLGEGDPSPDNVREIVGWDGVEVNGCGKNLVPLQTDENYWNIKGWINLNDGGITLNSGYRACNYQKAIPNQKYILTSDSTMWLGICFYDEAYNKIAFSQANNTMVALVSPQNTKYFRIYATYRNNALFQLEISSDATSYKPYQGKFISYQWKRLPDEYQEVEYIESTGTQYLITKTFDMITKVEGDIEFTVAQTGDQMIFGAYQTNASWYAEDYGGRNWYAGVSNSRYSGVGQLGLPYYDAVVGIKFKFILTEDSLRVITASSDDSASPTATTSAPTIPIYVFARNSNNSPQYINKGLRIYKLSMHNGNSLEQDLIPCYRKSDGEIGMYDTVSKTFYANQGTGTFLKGEDVFSDTVYGGYVDLVSGELVEEYYLKIFTGEENVQIGNWGVQSFLVNDYKQSTTPFITTNNLNDIYCNILTPKISGFYGMEEGKITCVGSEGEGFKYVIWKDEIFGDTIESCKAKLKELYESGTPLIFSSKVAEVYQKHHQLTPTQLFSFIGQNNFWSNADYVEIEYELKETEDIQKARKKIILNQPHIESVKDDLVNFTTNMKAPLKECKVYFEPVQEGSGDPSPDNVRPISGWTGVNIYDDPKYRGNIVWNQCFDPSTITIGGSTSPVFDVTTTETGFNVVLNGDVSGSGSRVVYFSIKWNRIQNHRYIFLCKIKSNTLKFGSFYIYHANGSSNRPAQNSTGQYVMTETYTGTTSDSKSSLRLYIYGIESLEGESFEVTDLMAIDLDMMFGTSVVDANATTVTERINWFKSVITNSNYREYNTGEITTVSAVNGDPYTSIPISWTDDIGTVYGGYVDLIKGELVSDMAYGQVTSEWLSSRESGYIGYTSSITALGGASGVWVRNAFNSTAKERKSGGIKANCNTFKVLMNSTGVSSSQNRTAFAVDSETITSVADFISAVETLEQNDNGLYLAYELATPIHYQLTPQQLLTFKGTNNIWSNSNGQTEVKFWTH